MDDMLRKSKERRTHLDDLEMTFTTMHAFSLHLNPKRCMLAIKTRKFLGFMMTRGIEPNTKKVQLIMYTQLPCSEKDVQKLTGGLAETFPLKVS